MAIDPVTSNWLFRFDSWITLERGWFIYRSNFHLTYLPAMSVVTSKTISIQEPLVQFPVYFNNNNNN